MPVSDHCLFYLLSSSQCLVRFYNLFARFSSPDTPLIKTGVDLYTCIYPVARSDARPPSIETWVRSSGPKIFFRGDRSCSHFYGHSLHAADSSMTVVCYWRKDLHLALVNKKCG